MRLPRRAPREVYRVYREDEFLSDAADHDHREAVSRGSAGRSGHAQAGTQGAGNRRLRGAAGAAMLLGVVGALGGVTLMSSVLSSRGRVRRPGAGERAATGSSAPSRLPGPPTPRRRSDRGRSRRRDGGQGDHAGTGPRRRAARGRGRALVHDLRRRAAALAGASATGVTSPTEGARPASTLSPTREFGFER
jgi:hypothetical protein